ncbi:MAG: SPFH domain-containing protein [Crocinitomicaceae bacterium]|nr:SPFH domain-containing protein [Crocinitomicaceae bacterium]|tara:strand:+ start:3481 stop:4416 length:936 start_codon:yes stop_codon:yes gene_type:complete
MTGTIVIVIIVVLVLFDTIIIVPEKTAKVIQRLGKFSAIAGAGLNFKLPIIDRVAGNINLKIQQLDVDIETKTLDNVFVDVRVSIQFVVIGDKIWEAFYALEDPEAQIASYVFDDVRAEVPKLELDDVFSRKEDIAVAVRHNLSEAMENYGYKIVKTLITDIVPDTRVKDSMNKINAAKRDKEAAREEAEAEKITIIKRAEADAESKRLQGEGIAQQRLEIIRGFKESVEDFQKALTSIDAQEIMQFVLMTQYFDTLNSIGANTNSNTLMVPHSPAAMNDFYQQIIEGTIMAKKAEEGDMKREVNPDAKDG